MRSPRTLRGDAFFHLLRDMVDSDEFRLMILPGLIATRAAMTGPHPVFFLHVPKTGGTSIRLAIGEALGVPALNLYSAWPYPDKRTHGYWPYWAGHVQADYFPDSHVGITLFREPRSRVLSHYRQQLYTADLVGQQHGWRYGGGAGPTKRSLPPFAAWLERRWEDGAISTLQYFIPSAEPFPNRSKSEAELQRLARSSDAELTNGAMSTLRRLGSAAWIHRSDDVLAAIEQVTGTAISELPRENVFEDKGYPVTKVRLTRQDREILEGTARLDRLVTAAAVELGLIRPLPADEAEAIFERDAARLGFVL